jgi:hypothetical protein
MRSRNRGMWFVVTVVGVVLFALSRAGASPTLGQVDTFGDGTTDGWQTGRAGQPQNIASGGPAGAGDAFLEMISTGTGGPGSKPVILNRAQWAGNYLATGITEVDMDLKNLGTTPLSMRWVVQPQIGASSGYSSTSGFALPADGAWHHAAFLIDSTHLTPVDGPPPLSTVLANVQEARIVSSVSPDTGGDTIAATIGVDNVRAVPEPAAVALIGLITPLLLRRTRG